MLSNFDAKPYRLRYGAGKRLICYTSWSAPASNGRLTTKARMASITVRAMSVSALRRMGRLPLVTVG
jgi:hypothetical protein